MKGRLDGTTVLVTRSERGNTALRRLLEERGARVLELPTVEIVDPNSWEECDAAISNIIAYDGFLFTSRNAVDRFLKRVDAVNHEGRAILTRRAVYAVGEKTEEALEAAGIPVAFSPDLSSAGELATSISSQSIAGKRFLFPKSSIARDVLPNALRSLHAVVHEIVVYRNVAPTQKDLDSVRDALSGGAIDIVTFFSPSAVRNFIQLMGEKYLPNVVVAVLGRTTEAAATDLGISVGITAPVATAESLVEALCIHIAQGNTHDKGR